MMDEMHKYYQILGLKPGASEKEILEAYKVLIKVWQPGRFSDDPNVQKIATEKIKEIDEAFKQLLIWIGSHHESGTPPTSQQEPLYEPSSKPLPRDDLKSSTEQVVVSPLGNKKKRGSFWPWLLWWRLDQNELDKQIAEYQSLKITQSARGQSFLFIIFSGLVTTILILFFNSSSANFVGVFISLLLGYFIYRGQKWAMITAMIYWSFNQLIQVYKGIESYVINSGDPNLTSISSTILIHLLWWAIYMHAFYLAFTAERLRKQNQAQIPKVFPKQNELEKLAELKDKGIITEEEFKKKQKLDLERESHHESEPPPHEPPPKSEKEQSSTTESRGHGESEPPPNDLPLAAAVGVIIICLMIAVVVVVKLGDVQPRASSSSVEALSSNPSPSLLNPDSAMKDQELEKISSLFENIRQANLQKNIDLFMSCFSRDFNGTEGKRQDTLKMWENYSYLDLSYDLKKQTVTGDSANVRLEWVARTSQKPSGKIQDGRTVLDIALKREDGHWKIIEIKPVS